MSRLGNSTGTENKLEVTNDEVGLDGECMYLKYGVCLGEGLKCSKIRES